MTVLLTRDPNDTGDIPAVEPGQNTRNLMPYETLPPAFRRPAATFETRIVIGGCRTIDLDDPDEFELVPPRPGQPRPKPTPPTPPPPPVVDDRPLSGGEEVVWEYVADPTPGYAGRHRARARWFDPILDGLVVGWARVRGSM